MNNEKASYYGVRLYSKLTLKFYDFFVMRFFAAMVWRYKESLMVGIYKENMSNNHAELGVGTGYCIDKADLESEAQRIGLFDLNEACLSHASQRLKRFNPECYTQNVLKEFSSETEQFDSLAIGGVLHCLPGEFVDKCRVFDQIRPILNNNARIFGYTLVRKGISESLVSRFFFSILSKLKVFNNYRDSAGSLKRELDRRFKNAQVIVVGQLAYFTADYSFC